MKSRRGFVLVLCLMMLALLAAIGSVLVSVATLDRSVSRSHLDEVRARLVTRAGIEGAIAKLQEPDGGAAWLADQGGLDVQLDGRTVRISGTLGGSAHAPNGDCYRLQVSDANSLIHVNDGVTEGGAGPVSRNLARILDVLGTVTGVPGAGSRILSGRPRRGYTSRSELERALGADNYRRIGRFLTLHAWVDPNVCVAAPLSEETLGSYPAPGRTTSRYRRGLVFAPEHAVPTGESHAISGLDDVSAPWIEIAARAPVNVNLAPREVLIALIADLQGWFVMGRRHGFPAVPGTEFIRPRRGSDAVGYLYSTNRISLDRATRIADRILERRSGLPFTTWSDFEGFCGTLGDLLREDRGIFYDARGWNSPGFVRSEDQEDWASRAAADVLTANFNPNCTLNELNPDRWTSVDKTDLICQSTEFCFQPMGIYRIGCEGYVTTTEGGRDLLEVRRGNVRARYGAEVCVKAFDVRRETSQADFSRGRLHAAPGPETTNNGFTLETGPEPAVGAGPAECRHSGWIQFSTLGGRPEGPGPELGAVLVGHFTRGHDLDYHAGGRPQAIRATSTLRNRPDPTESEPGPYDPSRRDHRLGRTLDDAVAGTSAPGDLRIDGAYVERGSALMYACTPEIFSSVGTAAFWMKLGFDPGLTSRPRTFFSMNHLGPDDAPQLNGVWLLPVYTHEGFTPDTRKAHPWRFPFGPWKTGVMVGGCLVGPPGSVGPAVQSYAPEPDEPPDRRQPSLPGAGWIHVVYHWDFEKRRVELQFTGGAAQDRAQVPDCDPNEPPPNLSSFVEGEAVLRIGEASPARRGGLPSWSADATIDELYVWKGDRIRQAEDLGKAGRFYRAYSTRPGIFDSGRIELPRRHRELTPPAGWTIARPARAERGLVRVLGAAVTWQPGGSGRWITPVVRPTAPLPRPVPTGGGGGGLPPDGLGGMWSPPPPPALILSLVADGGECPPLIVESAPGVTCNPHVHPDALPVLTEEGDLRYRIRLQVPKPLPVASVYDSPVVDDVTILLTTGLEVLSWEPVTWN